MSLINTFNRIAESVHLVAIFQKDQQNKALNGTDMIVTSERGYTFHLGLAIIILGMIRIVREMTSRSRLPRVPKLGSLEAEKKKK